MSIGRFLKAFNLDHFSAFGTNQPRSEGGAAGQPKNRVWRLDLITAVARRSPSNLGPLKSTGRLLKIECEKRRPLRSIESLKS